MGSVTNGVGSFASSGFGSFAGSGFGPSFSSSGTFDNVPGSNFVGTMVTSTTNADGVTEVTHKVTDGVESIVSTVGDVPESLLPEVNDVVEKVIPDVIEKVTDDLNNDVDIEKIVDNVVETVGDVVDDANLTKVLGPIIIRVVTNRRVLRALIKVLVFCIRLGIL